MAGWKKYFTPVKVDNQTGSMSPIGGGRPGPARANYSSFLPDVYAGSPNRVERYMQYDTMDMDSEVNAALDILAEFCTQKDKENATPFREHVAGDLGGNEDGFPVDSHEKLFLIGTCCKWLAKSIDTEITAKGGDHGPGGMPFPVF